MQKKVFLSAILYSVSCVQLQLNAKATMLQDTVNQRMFCGFTLGALTGVASGYLAHKLNVGPRTKNVVTTAAGYAVVQAYLGGIINILMTNIAFAQAHDTVKKLKHHPYITLLQEHSEPALRVQTFADQDPNNCIYPEIVGYLKKQLSEVSAEIQKLKSYSTLNEKDTRLLEKLSAYVDSYTALFGTIDDTISFGRQLHACKKDIDALCQKPLIQKLFCQKDACEIYTILAEKKLVHEFKNVVRQLKITLTTLNKKTDAQFSTVLQESQQKIAALEMIEEAISFGKEVLELEREIAQVSQHPLIEELKTQNEYFDLLHVLFSYQNKHTPLSPTETKNVVDTLKTVIQKLSNYIDTLEKNKHAQFSNRFAQLHLEIRNLENVINLSFDTVIQKVAEEIDKIWHHPLFEQLRMYTDPRDLLKIVHEYEQKYQNVDEEKYPITKFSSDLYNIKESLKLIQLYTPIKDIDELSEKLNTLEKICNLTKDADDENADAAEYKSMFLDNEQTTDEEHNANTRQFQKEVIHPEELLEYLLQDKLITTLQNNLKSTVADFSDIFISDVKNSDPIACAIPLYRHQKFPHVAMMYDIITLFYVTSHIYEFFEQIDMHESAMAKPIEKIFPILLDIHSKLLKNEQFQQEATLMESEGLISITFDKPDIKNKWAHARFLPKAHPWNKKYILLHTR